MRWIKKQLHIIMLGLFLLTNGIIITEASLSGGPSGARSSLVSLLLSVFVNRALPEVPHNEIVLEEMTVKAPTGEVINPLDHYYIPLGVTRMMNVTLLPTNTTDKSIKWETSNKDVLDVYPGGYLEARSIGANVTVTATPSNATKALTFYVTVHEKMAPPTFEAELEKATIDVGTTTTLSIILSTQAAREYDASKLRFLSSNESVATINNYGVVKGLSAGTTTLSIENHPTLSFTLTVTEPINPPIIAEAINLDLANDGYVYDETPLNFTFDKLNVTDQSVTITSSNPAVATIRKNEFGYFVYGTKVSGSALITVFYNTDFNVFASQEITMLNVMPTSLTLRANKGETGVGSTISLTALLKHSVIGREDDLDVTDQRIKYTSSDPLIASVSTSNLEGRVLGRKAGSVTISATSVANDELNATIELKIIPTPFINDTNFSDFQGFVRKALGHFMLFFVNGFFGFWTFYLFLKKTRLKRTLIYSLIIGLCSAALSEIIQRFIPGRNGAILDVVIDFAGYLTITLILFVIMRYYENRKQKVPKYPLP